ncbi:MAG: xanthine phosphoribosyltransferase [Clostridia bacterium]|nr:xanthine phosphoribosyltransferase [Clostridia bacterium]
MELLKQKILKDGVVKAGNVLKVDSFLNHQMDVALFTEIGKEFYNRFKDCNVTKILTIEASGIGIACVTAQSFNNIPVVFAKKSKTKNISDDVYTSRVVSFTHGNETDVVVSKSYLNEGDRVLIIDDFLANGSALEGLISIVNQSGATLVGAGIVIEKGFQPGGDLIRSRGIRVESLAIIDSMSDTSLTFRD